MWPLTVRARLYLQEGNLDAAQAELDSVPLLPFEAQQRILGTPLANETIYHAHAELAHAQGNHARMISLMDEWLASLSQNGFRLFVPSALHLKARALLAQGESEQARAVLEQARAEARAIHACYRLWPILCTLSELYVGLGDAAQAKLCREQARELVEYLAAQTPPELRHFFLNLPQVRAVLR